MSPSTLAERIQQLLVNALHVCQELPKSTVNEQLRVQLERSLTSAALNYAEATGSGSDRDYANKVQMALKEMKESRTNLSMLASLNPPQAQFAPLVSEADQLSAILFTCIKKARQKLRSP